MDAVIRREGGTRWILWLVTFLVISLVAISVFAMFLLPWNGWAGTGGTGGWSMMGYGGGMWWVMLLPMFFFLFFIVLLVYWALSPACSPPAFPSPALDRTFREAPNDILNLRYSRGELTREQYRTMKDDIAGRPPGPP